MKEQWQQLAERFSALSQREKWLVSLGGWAVVILIALTFLVDPISAEKKATQSRLNQELDSINVTRIEVATLIAKLKRDPDADIDKKLAELEKENQELTESLDKVVDSLITPSQMANLLETVLGSSSKLKLESLQSMPAESIAQNSEQSGYYLHPVKITISGSYFDIQDYLATLEAMPIKYYWRSFDYQVKEYPTAELIMVVYTLGTRQEFISG